MDDSESDAVGLHRRGFLGALAGTSLLKTIGWEFQTGATTHAVSTKSNLDSLNIPSGTVQDSLVPIITPSGIPFVRDPGSNNPNYPRYSISETADRMRPLELDSLLFVVRSSLAKAARDDIDTWETGLLTYALPVPSTVHRGNYLRKDEREWYRSLPTKDKYEWPDGSPLDNLENLAGRDFQGNRHELLDTPVPSPFAPGTVDHHVSSVRPFIEQGYGIVNLDQTNFVSRKGLDFSAWGQSAFRTYLRQLPDERLAELGIDDPATFDFRTYIRENGLLGADTPASDPVFREYFLHQHRQIRDFYRTVISEISNGEYPMDEVSFYPNIGMGPNLRYAPATAVYTADAFDVPSFEPYGRLPTVPPYQITDLRYKLFLAASRFERPPHQFGNIVTAKEARELGVDPAEEPYTTLARLQAAEGYAHGGRSAPDLLASAGADPVDGHLTRWMTVDGSVPEELATFVDFVRANRRFIENVRPQNRTALVFSLPTMLWNYVPQAGWGDGVEPTSYLQSLLGAAALLRAHQVPYDVIVFGQPNLWTDLEQLDRLSTYDTIVLPRMDVISDTQQTTLTAALDDGTNVIVNGPPPARDTDYQSTDRPAELFDSHQNARVLEADPAGGYEREETDGAAFIAALDDVSTQQVALSVDGLIGVNALGQPSAGRTIVHLVNYEYDLSEDTIQQQTDITLHVRDLPITPDVAKYYAPETATELEITTTESGHRVSIPELNVWGFVVFAADRSSIESGDRQAADQAIEEATAAVETAKAEGKTEGLPTAANSLRNATTASQYDAFEATVTAAKQASEAAAAAYKPPTIGIDVAHGQPPSGTGFERTQALREQYTSFEYDRISEWTPEGLSSVDVLLVPPAYKFKSARYDLSESEIALLEKFVMTGGCVVVLSRGGAADGVNRLLSPFGFETNLVTSVISDGSSSPRATTSFHPLTKMTTRIDVNYGAPLTQIPDEATVIARLPEDTTAYLEVSGESAAGVPMYAVRPYGSGHIAVLGSPEPFIAPLDNLFVARNAMQELGREARYAKRTTEAPLTSGEISGTSTPDSAQETPTPSSSSQAMSPEPRGLSTTTGNNKSNTEMVQTGSGPGFGIGAAIGGLAGTAALLRWLQMGRDE